MSDERLHPGQCVKFRLGDIHLPETTEVLARMTEDTELHGSITLLSDHGDQRSAFAVVEVKGILMPLIVPASSIRVLQAAADNGHATNGQAERPIVTRPVPSKTQQAL